MSTLITILHVIVCLFLMLTVLLQSGKGGGMGAAFGGGNAATVFGGSGASSFLRKLTAGAGTIFMITSMVLAFLASHNSADALEKFGESQAKLAADKEAAKSKALKDAKNAGSASSGSASSGSASSMSPIEIKIPQGSGSVTIPIGSGANVGSAVKPAEAPLSPGNPGGGVSGRAPTPSEIPLPAGTPNTKPNPSTPTSMGAAPSKNPPPPAPPAAPATPVPAHP